MYISKFFVLVHSIIAYLFSQSTDAFTLAKPTMSSSTAALSGSTPTAREYSLMLLDTYVILVV